VLADRLGASTSGKQADFRNAVDQAVGRIARSAAAVDDTRKRTEVRRSSGST